MHEFPIVPLLSSDNIMSVSKSWMLVIKEVYVHLNLLTEALASNEIIDHIFITNAFAVKKWGILTDSYHGKFPSDHFPVIADIDFR